MQDCTSSCPRRRCAPVWRRLPSTLWTWQRSTEFCCHLSVILVPHPALLSLLLLVLRLLLLPSQPQSTGSRWQQQQQQQQQQHQHHQHQ